MQPKTLALIDDDAEYSEFLTQFLQEQQGIAVSRFDDSNALLAAPDAFSFDFYLVDLMLPGVNGVELIKILRRRTDAGVVVVSGRLGPEVFREVITAGADMYLVKPVQFEQVALAIAAVQRRVAKPSAADAAWRLDRASGELIVPDGTRIQLSDADRQLLECFAAAGGEPVTREALLAKLGREVPEGSEDDGLSATIYRLRRRIERATPALVPLQSKSRVGYVFRAPLTLV
ncbi:MAG: response regulator transcription factor [Roseateles sp.]|jgi:two-component system OmpR family response regulator|nr:DNA-binding response regulator [Methylibium sp.]MBY0364899.1 response regulator transcription factor [Burkholderiaceae bacterium]RTL19350.1 MAG: response regulator transcription factor [Burkholderiales bacterium]